jgi:hypothetical protein
VESLKPLRLALRSGVTTSLFSASICGRHASWQSVQSLLSESEEGRQPQCRCSCSLRHGTLYMKWPRIVTANTDGVVTQYRSLALVGRNTISVLQEKLSRHCFLVTRFQPYSLQALPRSVCHAPCSLHCSVVTVSCSASHCVLRDIITLWAPFPLKCVRCPDVRCVACDRTVFLPCFV